MKLWTYQNDLTGVVLGDPCGCSATSLDCEATTWRVEICERCRAEERGRMLFSQERRTKDRARKAARKAARARRKAQRQRRRK